MFNILNILPRLRKYSPLVCKFLDIVTGIFHVGLVATRRCSYLSELLGFRNTAGAAIGLAIALPSVRPAFTRFR
jgi:hypothetical protein